MEIQVRGALWEGRYKSSPIHTHEYLLACCRYVELNPLRAGIVDSPESRGEWELIRQAVQRGQLTGSNQFVEEVFKKTARRVELRGQGRPKKKKK